MAVSPLALFFGEDANDTHALTHLARALLPESTDFDAKPIRRPPILRRDAQLKKRRDISEEISGFASSFEAKRPKVIVVAHRDCDDVEDTHEVHANALEADLRNAGVKNPVAATPAWEIETWWMLFPTELAATRKCWRKVDYSKRAVGMIKDSKEVLTRDLRPVGRHHRCPDYSESDSIKIAEGIAKNRPTDDINLLRSAALLRFREKLYRAFGIPLTPPPPFPAPAAAPNTAR